ncbi:hypothetical protein Vspart_03497 [Vibrio spartinae]|uniref:Uncharacterized protein n=1 Tax=Vibrio spartinae TaxID=1918945 RepID=A0A1N6M226_9VIBR|nr:hypothetical protein Vspart_03497 [Vibrio spartinae]SIO93440.1 hypothetical protein VSP9026_01107 [Vibrio spartinae]
MQLASIFLIEGITSVVFEGVTKRCHKMSTIVRKGLVFFNMSYRQCY